MQDMDPPTLSSKHYMGLRSLLLQRNKMNMPCQISICYNVIIISLKILKPIPRCLSSITTRLFINFQSEMIFFLALLNMIDDLLGCF